MKIKAKEELILIFAYNESEKVLSIKGKMSFYINTELVTDPQIVIDTLAEILQLSNLKYKPFMELSKKEKRA